MHLVQLRLGTSHLPLVRDPRSHLIFVSESPAPVVGRQGADDGCCDAGLARWFSHISIVVLVRLPRNQWGRRGWSTTFRCTRGQRVALRLVQPYPHPDNDRFRGVGEFLQRAIKDRLVIGPEESETRVVEHDAGATEGPPRVISARKVINGCRRAGAFALVTYASLERQLTSLALDLLLSANPCVRDSAPPDRSHSKIENCQRWTASTGQ